MPLLVLDHVDIRTANLAAMERFYREALGLDAGFRPAFACPGAWLYCDGRAAVHLVGVERQPAAREPSPEHFAFLCADLAATRARLDAAGVGYRESSPPAAGTRQLRLADPDGNHIELQFPRPEA